MNWNLQLWSSNAVAENIKIQDSERSPVYTYGTYREYLWGAKEKELETTEIYSYIYIYIFTSPVNQWAFSQTKTTKKTKTKHLRMASWSLKTFGKSIKLQMTANHIGWILVIAKMITFKDLYAIAKLLRTRETPTWSEQSGKCRGERRKYWLKDLIKEQH